MNIFETDISLAHVPENIRAVLGDKTPERDNRIKQFLMSRLQQILR